MADSKNTARIFLLNVLIFKKTIILFKQSWGCRYLSIKVGKILISFHESLIIEERKYLEIIACQHQILLQKSDAISLE